MSEGRPGLLVARGVRKSFGDLLVLDQLDLQVSAGQTLALLGPSGCGKSTLLRILAGLEPFDAGSVTVDGQPVVGPSPERGMVAQAGTLFPWLNVSQNVGFGPRERGVAGVDRLVADLLAVTGPFGALDAQTRLRMHEWVRGLLAERPTSTVLVTHDVDEALLLGDRLGMLSSRPSRVVGERELDFGDQRGRHTLSDPAFVRLKASVLDEVLTA